jgi:DNA-binding response OmpR family regulator
MVHLRSATARPSHAPADDRRHSRVLVVEDDPPIAWRWRLALQEAGYEASAAPDGKIALDLVASYQPHVIVLDVLMPRMDGLLFLRHLREQSGEGRPRVVLITGYRSDHVDTAAKLYGATVLDKPCRPEQVVAAVRHALAV